MKNDGGRVKFSNKEKGLPLPKRKKQRGMSSKRERREKKRGTLSFEKMTKEGP